MKRLLVLVILVFFLTGCEAYQILYEVPEKESNEKQRVINIQLTSGLSAVVFCEDRIVCYESSHSYGVGLSCIELNELGVRGEKYSSKC